MGALRCLTGREPNRIYDKTIDFDPKKEAIDLAKHHVSLARWVDLEIRAIVADDRSTTASPDFVLTDISIASRTVWFLQFAMDSIVRSAFDARMQRR